MLINADGDRIPENMTELTELSHEEYNRNGMDFDEISTYCLAAYEMGKAEFYGVSDIVGSGMQQYVLDVFKDVFEINEPLEDADDLAQQILNMPGLRATIAKNMIALLIEMGNHDVSFHDVWSKDQQVGVSQIYEDRFIN